MSVNFSQNRRLHIPESRSSSRELLVVLFTSLPNPQVRSANQWYSVLFCVLCCCVMTKTHISTCERKYTLVCTFDKEIPKILAFDIHKWVYEHLRMNENENTTIQTDGLKKTGVYKICTDTCINPYPTAFPYGNGMVLHFYQQQESSTTKTVHKVINKGLKTYV